MGEKKRDGMATDIEPPNHRNAGCECKVGGKRLACGRIEWEKYKGRGNETSWFLPDPKIVQR